MEHQKTMIYRLYVEIKGYYVCLFTIYGSGTLNPTKKFATRLSLWVNFYLKILILSFGSLLMYWFKMYWFKMYWFKMYWFKIYWFNMYSLLV